MLLPSRFFFAGDQLTYSARRLLLRLGSASLSLLLAAVAIGLLDRGNWQEVASGALFAWNVSGIIWAITSYRSGSDETLESLRRIAEQDVLHARLNHLAAKAGAPLLNINEGHLDGAVAFRLERQAHRSGLEEFGDGYVSEGGQDFWDNTACGYPPAGHAL